MRSAIAWFARNSVAANVLMVLLVLGGTLSLPFMKQEVFPEIGLESLSVQVPYPGASPEEVEEAVCIRVEEALDGLPGIKSIRSTASEGMGSVVVELLRGEDVQRRLADVRAHVDAIDTFPEEVEEPVVQQLEITMQVLKVAVSGDADEWTIKRLGQRVRDEIAALPGVTDVSLFSTRPYEISIEVSEAALRRFGITFDDVVQAVRRSSFDLPGGSVKAASGEILLRAKGQAYRGAEFERIALVSRRDGTRLTVGDVATVVDGFEETDVWSRFDGEPAVLVQVYRVGSQRALDIADAVQRYVAEASLRMPEGVSLTVWDDSSVGLRERLDTMLRNARGGFLLVVLILACFLRLRLSLWVSLGIPVAFLGTFALLPFLDVSINIISLMAFIVVLGIVVDDAIVVGENSYTEQVRTGSKLEGAILGAQGVSVPVVFGVLTTVAAFAPMLFVPGPMGKVTSTVPKVVIACLALSLIEAMFILPAHLGHSRRDRVTEDVPSNAVSRGWRRFQDRIAAGLSWLIDVHYRAVLGRALEWRYLTIAAAAGLLLLMGGLVGGGYLRFVFQSVIEADRIAADVELPLGTPAAVTGRAVEQIERAALALQREIDAGRPEGAPSVFRHRLASVGSQPFKDLGPSLPGFQRGGQGGHVGEVQLELAASDERDLGSGEIAALWRERVGEIPGVEALTYEASMGEEAPAIEVRLAGSDVDRLRSAAVAVKEVVARYPGVHDVADSFRKGKQELELTILPAGEALGVTLQDVARQVRQGFYGAEAQRIQRGRDDVKVMVRYPRDERRSLTNVERMYVPTPEGDEVPFSAVASARLGDGVASIARSDGHRVVDVTAEVDNAVADANAIVRELGQGVLAETLEAFPGVRYSFEGQEATQREFLSALIVGQTVALFVIYALLAIPLGSYVQPLIIMSAIPFGVVGAAGGHLLMGYDLNMYSVIGLVALSGIVVNASLVLVDYVNKTRATGASMHDAVLAAGRARFRPILLTSLTTFAGLTPIMLERSMQAQFMVPMAISISFGVLSASFITLLLVPASYMILEDLRALVSRESAAGPAPGGTGEEWPSRAPAAGR